jgi:multimeric flavodoxin WrbA
VEVVIAFYSRTGNTQAMADLLLEETRLRGHTVRLVQIAHDRKPGYFGCLSLASGKRDADIANPEEDLDLGTADLVILGAPVWGGRFAPFVRTFLERAKGREGKPAGVFVSCSSTLDRAERFAPELEEYATSMGLTVKGTMCASRKDRLMHREIGRAFLDGLLGPAPAAPAATSSPDTAPSPPPPPQVEGEAPVEAPKEK